LYVRDGVQRSHLAGRDLRGSCTVSLAIFSTPLGMFVRFDMLSLGK